MEVVKEIPQEGLVRFAFALDRSRVRVLDGLCLAFGISAGCTMTPGLLAAGCDLGFPGEKTTLTGVNPAAIAAAELNGDGRIDLVTANSGSDDVSVLLGNGDGTFQAEERFATGPYPRGLAAADLNGDGAIDIVTANENSNDLSVLLGNGTGRSRPSNPSTPGRAPRPLLPRT